MYQKAFGIFKQNPWQQPSLSGTFRTLAGSTAEGAGALSLMEQISEDMKNAMRTDQALKVIMAYRRKLKKSLDAYPEGDKRMGQSVPS